MNIYKIIENEITDYESKTTEISNGVHRSAYKRIKRISFFQNEGGEDNKINEFGQYQYWLKPIKVYIDSTVKNLRIDTKNFLLFSINPIKDFPVVFTLNGALREYLFDTNRDTQLKEDVESYVGWGNLLWGKTEDGYEAKDLSNTYIINQSARTVDDTSIIERHQLTQSQLRAMEGVFDNIDKVIEDCGGKTFSTTKNTTDATTTNDIYEIFIRSGEVSEKDLFEAQGKEGGDPNKFQLARIAVAGLDKNKSDKKYILMAEPFGKKKMSDFFKEAHLGNYNNTWLREGLYEMFFDYIVAIREIDNDIQEGLTWASKVIFGASDIQTFQSVRTDIENGRIIKTKDLKQVDVRLQNLDQLIARRNNLIEEMDKVAHSFEITQGQTPPSGTPLGSTRIADDNAGKHFVVLRQKFTIPLKHIYKEWVLDKIVKNIKAQDIIKITGDENVLQQFRQLAVDSWYTKNLVKIGFHTPEMAEQIKAEKMEEMSKYDALVKNLPEVWEGVMKRLYITITGENMNMEENLSTLTALLSLEQDPIRRAHILDMIYAIKNIPVPPPPTPTQQPTQPQQPQDNSQIVKEQLV